jgi:hypothetical protein
VYLCLKKQHREQQVKVLYRVSIYNMISMDLTRNRENFKAAPFYR